jgi:hypothetical protein
MRSLVAVLFALAVPVSAQAHLAGGTGPYVSVDLVGGAFPDITPAGDGVGGGVGYRFGNGLDAEVFVSRAGGVADTLFPYPPETHLGAAVAVAFGPEASPWRVGGVGKVVVADRTVFAFPPEGPTELREGPGVIDSWARLSLARYVRLADGPVRVFVGGGPHVGVRRLPPSPLIFEAGTPNERVVPDEETVETQYGVSLAAPVAVRLGRGMTLALEPEARFDLEFFLLGGFLDGQVTARLNF